MQEKRRYTRKEVNEPVSFSTESGPRVPGVCRDLSLGGMAIKTDRAAPFGTTILVHVRLKGLSEECTIRSVVRWTKEGMMGIQFGLIGARETHALAAMLAG